jgi:hypothetical protein
MNSRSSILAVAALLWLPAGRAPAQDLETNRATLRGLESVFVAVERLDPDSKYQGLDEAQIRRLAEERLRRAGIAIRSANEYEVSPDKSFLYIRLSAMRAGLCSAYAVTVAVRQEVVLLRDPDIGLVAETWSVGGVGTAEPAKLKEQATLALNGYLDRFLAARRSSAPK